MKTEPVEFALEQVLVCTCCEIYVNGWISAIEARESTVGGNPISSTKDKVWILLQNNLESGKMARKDLMSAAKEKGLDLFGDFVKEEVQAATKWAKNLIDAERAAGRHVSDYDMVIADVARNETVGLKQLGYAVSIIQSYSYQHNHQQRSPKSEWVGNLRSQIECDMTVMSIKESTPPGEWWLVNVKDTDGNSLKWFSIDIPRNPVGEIVIPGDMLKIKGKVIRHEEWKGYRTTKLNRVKMV